MLCGFLSQSLRWLMTLTPITPITPLTPNIGFFSFHLILNSATKRLNHALSIIV